METRSFPKTIRVGLWWTLSAGTVLALIAGQGTLVRSSICILAVAGGLATSIVAWEHGWLRLKPRSIPILGAIWGGMFIFALMAWPSDETKRPVIVSKILVEPFQVGQPVTVRIIAKHVAYPEMRLFGYWEFFIDKEIMVFGGGSPAEQRTIEDGHWDEFIKTTAKNSPNSHTSLQMPFEKEVSLLEPGEFNDEVMKALVTGQVSLYVMGIITDQEEKHITPYCAIKSARRAVIAYCQDHN